jgi:hypothetical protein
MPEAIVEVTSGTGTKLHSWTRTVGANTVHDTFALPGELPYSSYIVMASAVSIGTANDHILAIMAGSALNVRIRRWKIKQVANATTAQATTVSLYRLTTAGTGGTAVTPAPMELADGASGATARTLPTAKGTESTELMRIPLVWRQAVSATAAQADDGYEWEQHPYGKPIVIAAGTSNGIAFKTNSAVATCSVTIIVDFVETTF